MRPLRADEIPLLVKWEQERPYPWTSEHFRETLNSSTTKTFVWEPEGAAIGFATVQLVRAEAYLQNILIEPGSRRKGQAETFLQKVMMWARSNGAEFLTLDVDAENVPACRLYQKMGFHMLERRKKSYPRGEDAIVMRHSL